MYHKPFRVQTELGTQNPDLPVLHSEWLVPKLKNLTIWVLGSLGQ